MWSRKRNFGGAGAGLAALVALLSACSDIPTAPPPGLDTEIQATIEGSISYVGPRPICTYDALGAPVAIPGVVVMTLIDDSNPPPPEGTNQGAASFLTIPGTELFTLADCRPADPGAFDPDDTVMRGVDFTWPQIDLARASGQSVSYRVTGFYDQRGDFNPFFTIQSATTKGDVAGAAVKSATDPTYELVTVGNVVDSPLGEVHIGVAVMLGGVVTTEPPMFRIVGGEAMNAALPVPAQLIPQTMQTVLEASSSFTLRMFGRDLASGGPDDQDLERVLSLLRPDDEPMAPRVLDPDLGDEIAYAWYHDDFDLDADGTPDPHPVLGPIRQPTTPEDDIFRLESPIVLLQRIRSREEIRAGIPDVGLQAASPNRNHGTFPTLPPVEYPDTQVIVPPIATVLLQPSSPICLVPYMPPGSPREFYEENPDNPAPVECAEIPTGAYGVNVMNGLVGGTPVADGTSETGFVVAGGAFSSQLWAVPNALGDAAQLEGLLPEGQGPVASQSIEQALRFVDPTPAGPTGRQEDEQACVSVPLDPFAMTGVPTWKEFPYAGECEAGQESLEDFCCASVRHLCFVPRCPYEACDPGVISSPREGTGELRNFSYTNRCGETVEARAYFPECVPFQLPTVCCDDIWNTLEGGMPDPLTEPFADPNTCP